MNKLLLITLLSVVGCGPTAVSNPDSGNPSEPTPDCEFLEFMSGPSTPTNAQFITSLPIYSEFSVCGNNTHIVNNSVGITYDSDFYLFPLISLSPVVSNFSCSTIKNHTPVINTYVIYDDLDPIQIGNYTGSSTIVNVLDMSVPLLGSYRNDLIVEVTSFVTEPFSLLSSEDYILKFW